MRGPFLFAALVRTFATVKEIGTLTLTLSRESCGRGNLLLVVLGEMGDGNDGLRGLGNAMRSLATSHG